MKITIITNYWKESDGGGVKTYLTNLVDEMENITPDVDVIFRLGFDPQNYHPIGNKLMFSYKSYFKLKKLKPDVILSQGTWYCLLPSYMYKKHHNYVKLIHTFHTEPDANQKLSKMQRIFFQHLLDECDYVTFVSKSLKSKIQDNFGLKFKKTKITYAGVNIPAPITENVVGNFREKFRIKDDSIVLLAIGLTALKHKAEGAKLLIKAISKLADRYPTLILILTRYGGFSNELKEFAIDNNVSGNVIFTGTIEDPNVPLQLCDIYTHTPLGEGGVSISLLEAMSMGKPVIATSVGGIPEVIEDGINGFLVQPDVDSIVEKIVYLLENKDFALIMGMNAHETVKEKFTWKNAVNGFLELVK